MTPQYWEVGGLCSKGQGGGQKWGDKCVPGTRTAVGGGSGTGTDSHGNWVGAGGGTGGPQCQGVPDTLTFPLLALCSKGPKSQGLERQDAGARGRLPNFPPEAKPQGTCSLVPSARAMSHPGAQRQVPMHTHTQRSSHSRAIFAVSSPPALLAKLSPRGLQSSVTSCTVGPCLSSAAHWEPQLLGGGKPHPIAHMSPTPLASGDGSPEPGTGLLKGWHRSF